MRNISAFACAAVALVLCGSCRNELNPPKPRPRVIVWKAIGTWSGHGSMQTDSFDIGIFRWRVRWKASRAAGTAAGQGHFTLSVNSAVSGRPLDELVRQDGPGEGVAEVNDDPRLYYLVIDSKNLDWSVTVEEPIATGASR